MDTRELTTHIYRDFAGQKRKLELRLGEVAELERLAQAGIGEIMLRIASHRFQLADVRETIRLALEGGGMSEPEATALTKRYIDGMPLVIHLEMAGDIIGAFINGVTAGERPKKDEAESATTASPFPPFTASAP